MNSNKFKVLLIINECNPEWASVPLEGYRYYESISKLVDTTLVTHERNQSALEKIHGDRDITYIAESKLLKQYYKIAKRLSTIKKKTIWPLRHVLTYPLYGEFNHLVYSTFKHRILRGDYDIVHALTPMMPRYPVKVVKACQNQPFILGPVNGGVPFPKSFREVALQEFSYFNFMRMVGRFIIPGYRRTYQEADHILAGSTYTLNFLGEVFNLENQRIELFYENGISNSFIKKEQEAGEAKSQPNKLVKLLFVGRLVPYKGADMLIEAVNQLEGSIQEKISLTIVGDGSERNTLEQQVQQANLGEIVNFTGWVPQQETIKYYSSADIFCFPSIREFGGAVVLEAMASGLPCIVVNNGGIGEYVTEETGFSINPVARDFVIQELKKCIEKLVENQALRQNMSRQAIKRAMEFTWDVKAQKIVDTYRKASANYA
ncbi:MAG: glycosyltransferase family 4 protein [Symploca sp. SIO3E6]|nr:glycosyltransferase family 4 protein [Caldora sp. SIO3E6]